MINHMVPDRGHSAGRRSRAWEEKCAMQGEVAQLMPEGNSERHTLFKSVIQSVTLDAKSFATQ